MKLLRITLSGLTVLILYSCSTLILKPADFSWPIESVLKVEDDGHASADRYTFSFNIKPLFYEEMEDSLAYLDREIRVIRNYQGYYFITANDFKNVYVFESSEGEFELEEKIPIDETGLKKPVFNQRSPYIELIDGTNRYYLSKSGIEEVNNESN